MTVGSLVGIVRFAEAVDEVDVPESVAVADVVPPARPEEVTVTRVPGGMFDAATATFTGLVVLLGRVISGVEYEPVGEAGVAVPAIEVIVRLGVFGSATRVGWFREGGVLYVTVLVFEMPSTRIRPTAPVPPLPVHPPPPTPPATLIVPPVPVIVVATRRMPPPLPPPPYQAST